LNFQFSWDILYKILHSEEKRTKNNSMSIFGAQVRPIWARTLLYISCFRGQHLFRERARVAVAEDDPEHGRAKVLIHVGQTQPDHAGALPLGRRGTGSGRRTGNGRRAGSGDRRHLLALSSGGGVGHLAVFSVRRWAGHSNSDTWLHHVFKGRSVSLAQWSLRVIWQRFVATISGKVVDGHFNDSSRVSRSRDDVIEYISLYSCTFGLFAIDKIKHFLPTGKSDFFRASSRTKKYPDFDFSFDKRARSSRQPNKEN
jgi:hypothetical protein